MHFPGELANCGKLHMASVFDGLEFKPHLGGHWDKAHYSRGVLHGAMALTSNRMLFLLPFRLPGETHQSRIDPSIGSMRLTVECETAYTAGAKPVE